jgi:hypothetical protein
MKQKLPPHNMVVVVQVGLDLFNISYIKYFQRNTFLDSFEIQQCIKYNLSSEDVSQFLGNN